MADGGVDNVVRGLRRAVLLVDGGGLTDGLLLGRYVGNGDPAAFEAIVRRHGPMVLGVCRRALDDAHDAEDAFQATFLVLVKKAASVVPAEQVGHWLYGVAYRTALKARTMRAQRQAKEKEAGEMPRQALDEGASRELRQFLDEELGRLPAEHQVPLVLCYLEGRSKSEVARQLGIPEGTVSSRLARGKELLRDRLTRRGMHLAAGALAVALSQGVASAAMPPALASSTVQAAALFAAGVTAAGAASAEVVALAEEVLRVMFPTKMKTVLAMLLVVGVLGAAAGALSYAAPADKPAVEKKAADRTALPADKKDLGAKVDPEPKAVKPPKADVRGVVKKVAPLAGDLRPERLRIWQIRVEGKMEPDTREDSARVTIMAGAKIEKWVGGKRVKATVKDIKVGCVVQCVFTGAVLESKPVQAHTKEVLILEAPKE
jgi:RNA polymerase sigma factor (sigma-70 family)